MNLTSIGSDVLDPKKGSAAGWQTFSTAEIQRPRRLKEWNRFGDQTFCNMVVDPAEGTDFHACISRIEFGQLGMALLRATPATASAAGGTSSDWAAPEKDALLLVAPRSGICSSEQGKKITLLRPGDLYLRDLAKPWVHRSMDVMEILTLKLPYSVLQSRVDDPQRLIGKVLSGEAPEVAIAADLIRSAHQTLERAPGGAWCDELAELVMSAVQMLYRSFDDSVGNRNRAQQSAAKLHRAAMRHICAHFQDPELTVASVSDALGVSQRQLQRAFLATGDTASAFLQSQRLEQASRLLSGRGGKMGVCVTEAAFASGFNDVSHFSRMFARRFGVAPSKWRSARAR